MLSCTVRGHAPERLPETRLHVGHVVERFHRERRLARHVSLDLLVQQLLFVGVVGEVVQEERHRVAGLQ